MKTFTQKEMFVKVINLLETEQGVTEPVYEFLKEFMRAYEITFITEHVQRRVRNYDLVFYYLTKEDAANVRNIYNAATKGDRK